VWVLGSTDEALGVRHEPKDSTCTVGQTRHRFGRTVRIDGIGTFPAVRINVLVRDVPIRLQLLQRFFILGDDLAFPMSDRHIDLPLGLEKDTPVGLRQQVYPPILILAAVVVGDGDILLLESPITRENAHFDQDLKAVADSEYELSVVDEFPNRLGEMVNDLIGQNLAGRHIVAITEPAREDEDVILIEQGLTLNQSVDVYTVGPRSGQFQRMLSLDITIDSGRS